ncbi:MAG TPA: TIGR03761 family integrating conjugative element protein [Gammaproteobacteria bacterium]|nr:TIGR03761 family integrating conjugative element protein [Gammaproteobacteria bacterium]
MKSEQALLPEKPEKVKSPKQKDDSPGVLHGQTWLTVQTYQAQQLIHGRNKSKDKPAIIGLVGFADRLRVIWQAARDDDPFADWWLIKIHDALENTRRHFIQRQSVLDSLLLNTQGLEVNVAVSQRPYRLQLQFANPYAYQGAQLIAAYDNLVRTTLTCRHIGQLNDEPATASISNSARRVRATLSTPQGYRSLGLNREKLLAGDVDTRVTGLMGDIPEAVLSGEQRAPITPRKIHFPKQSHRPSNLKSQPSSFSKTPSNDENHDT